MRIIVHPLHLFTLFGQDSETMEWAFKRFLEVAKGSVVLFMPLNSLDLEHLCLRNKRLYHIYREFFEIEAKLHLCYPEMSKAVEDNDWNYPSEMDELLLGLPKGEEIVFCGGYVENCLPRSLRAFRRLYGTFCEEAGITIRVDEERSFCASATHTREALFLDTRVGEAAKHSRTEFEWWSKAYM